GVAHGKGFRRGIKVQGIGRCGKLTIYALSQAAVGNRDPNRSQQQQRNQPPSGRFCVARQFSRARLCIMRLRLVRVLRYWFVFLRNVHSILKARYGPFRGEAEDAIWPRVGSGLRLDHLVEITGSRRHSTLVSVWLPKTSRSASQISPTVA